MKKIISDSFPLRVLLFVFFALLAMSQLAPLASNSVIPNEADLYNHIAAIVQAAYAMTQHQFPLRVAPLQYPGWSYPYFQFYAPTSYVYAAAIYKWLTPTNPYAAYKLTIWSALLFGGIYLYRLAYWLTKSYPAAILASVVFLTAPYFNILVGGLGAFNEIIAMSLLPFILFYTLRDYSEPNNVKYLLLVSFGWYLLITTHIITFIYGAALIGILLFLITCQTKRWKNLTRAGIAIVFGAALATWYLVPMILFSHDFAIQGSFDNADAIYVSAPSLANLLSPTLEKILNMQQNVATRAHPAIGLPILVGVGVAVYAVFMNCLLHKKNKGDYYILPLLVIFFIAFFMLWSPVNFWQYLPSSLLVIQYTMRMLAQLVWIGALIFAWSVCWLFKNNLDMRHAVLGVLLIFAATNALLPTLANGPSSIEDIVKNPTFPFNPEAYLIDPDKKTDYVDQIDNYQLQTLMSNHNLLFTVEFNMPVALLRLAKNPQVILAGYVVKKDKTDPYELSLWANDTKVAAKILKSSEPINWPVSLAAVKMPTKGNIPIRYRLKSLTKKNFNKNQITIKADKVELSGFLNAEKTIGAQQMVPKCKSRNSELVCHVNVPSQTTLIELPMFYYPKLLHITVNDKIVSYSGILNRGRIMVGIVPQQGVENTIRAKFVGLPWANWESRICWALWGVLFLLYGIKSKKSKGFVE